MRGGVLVDPVLLFIGHAVASGAIAAQKPLQQQWAAQLVAHDLGSNYRQETVRKLAHQAG